MPTSYVSRISQWIEKRYNAKGGNVITEIDPVAKVNLPVHVGVEDRYLQGWNRFIGSVAIVAVAAQFSRAMLRNPKGSNMIAVIESARFSPAASDWSIANTASDLTNVQAPGTLLRRLDSRSGFTDSTSIFSSDTNASQFLGSANVSMRGFAITEIVSTVDQEITILPGDAFFMASDVVNQFLQLNLMWRERALEQSELT